MSGPGCQPVANATLSMLAPPGYKEAYLGIFVLFLALSVLGLIAFFRQRKRSGRLAKRSGTLLLLSAAGTILSCFVVFLREFIGREHVQCLAVLTIHYILMPLICGPLVAKVYVHAYRLRKSQVRAGLSFAAVKKEQERIDRGETKPGQNLAHDISAFVTLQGKKQRSPAGTATSTSTFGHKDNFEVVSPVSDGFDIGDDDDNQGNSPVITGNKAISMSPIRPSTKMGDVARRQDSDAEPDIEQSGRLHSPSSRSSLVELSPGPQNPPGSPASPVATRKGSKKSKSTTEDIVRKASRNSSNVVRQSRGSKQGSRMSSIGAVGWWSPKAQDVDAEVHLDELIKNESTIWGALLVLVFSLPFIAAVIIRSQTDTMYNPSLACTGCDLEPIDMYIITGLSVFMISVFASSIIIMWHAPDPLGILWEAKLCVAVVTVLGIPMVALYLIDPMDIEKSHHFTWLTFQTITSFAILMIQTFGQVAYTNWANSLVPKNINLLRLLENVELRDMFDDHLASEFSIENLRFWDRAIHWKISYEDLAPDDVQRKARDLYQVFIQREAAMALNLSAANLSNLMTAFSSNHSVDRRVFDDALKECFKLMNDGLARFLRGEKYRTFVKHAPDFEGDMLRNKEVGLDLNVTCDQYLKQLEGLHRPSYSNVMTGTTVNGPGGDSTPRRPSRHSFVSSFTSRKPMTETTVPLAPPHEEGETGEDEEKSRPLSMRVRKSVAQQDPGSADRKRGASLVQIISQQTLSNSNSNSRKSTVDPSIGSSATDA